MAGSVTDKFKPTFNAGNPNVAKVTATRAASGTTLTCDNLSGWPVSASGAVDFSTYKIDTNNAVVANSQIDWVGLVTSSTTIGSLTHVAGAADTGNAIGDVVEANPTANWAHTLFQGLSKEHSQLDGSHTGINSTSITNVGALTQTGTTSLNGSWDGWVGANESWAFASSTTITVPTDATTKYDIGDYLKMTQSATVKYFIITGVTSTLLTVTGLNGATVANSAITANAYSKARNPHGFVAAPVSLSQTAKIVTGENTSSTGYNDIATVGPSVTVQVGSSGLALVVFSATATNNTNGDYVQMGVTLSGANTVAAASGVNAYRQMPSASYDSVLSHSELMTGLTAGSTTFKLQYGIAAGGTGTFSGRKLSVIPL